MAERITSHQLDQLAKMISEEMRWTGILPEGRHVWLEHGTKTYGRAFRIYTASDTNGGVSDSPLYLGDGYLGMTKREAWLSLRAILRTFEAVRHAKN